MGGEGSINGFGGGGGGSFVTLAGPSNSPLVIAGGGGYSGVGGSFIASTATNLVETASFQSGNGLVTIDLVFPAPPVTQTPIPPARWLVGSALTGLLGLRRRKLSA